MHRLTLFIFLAALSVYAQPAEQLSMPKQLQGELPWFALDTKDGEKSYYGVLNNNKLKDIAKKRGSKRIVFSFFATWCVSCKESLILMNQKAAELEKNGVLLVLVNMGEQDFGKIDEWAKPFLRDEWFLSFDSFKNLSEDFGLSKPGGEMPLPQTLILDPDLRPVMLLGDKGDDFLQILLKD